MTAEAPTTAYLENSNLKLQVNEENLSGTILATYNHLIPRKLYGNIAATIAMLKLDGIEQDLVISDNLNVEIERGFIAYCIIGSANYNLRAAARRGKLNGSLLDNNSVVINNRQYFNDGCLNHRSPVEYLERTSERANNIGIKVSLFIPYHNFDVELRLISTVTRAGVPVALSSWETPKKIYYDITSRGQTKEATLSILDSNLIFAGDELTFVIQTQNFEGIYEDVALRQFFVKPVLVTWNYSPTYASYARDIPTTTYDIRSPRFPIYDGTTLYLNDIMGTTAGAGFYADNERWYQVDNTGTIIDSAYFGYWPAGDPLNPSDYMSIVHHGTRNNFLNISSGYVEGIDYVNGIGWDSPVTIYKHKTDGLYYVNNTPTNTVVANGYYVMPFGGGDVTTLLGQRIIEAVRIVSGSVTETWHYDIINQTWEQL